MNTAERLQRRASESVGAGYASPGIFERRRGRGSEAPAWPRFDGVSREQEVRLMGTLHDIAAAFARCARACRDGRSKHGGSSREEAVRR